MRSSSQLRCSVGDMLCSEQGGAVSTGTNILGQVVKR